MVSTPPIEENPEQTKTSFGDWDHEKLLNAAEKSKLLRALFTNQLFVQPDGLHLRLNFGESVEGEPFFHTSLVVPNSDALVFGQLLVSMAQAGVEQQITAMKQLFSETEQAPVDGE